MMKKWGEGNTASASYVLTRSINSRANSWAVFVSPNGWTDSELANEWLIKDFDTQTKDKAGGHTHVLLLDGHSSHHTPEFLWFVLENNIVILGYPPHCTHALQGLDIVCIARMKEVWKEVLSNFEKASGEKVGKRDFTALFGKAYLKAFTTETVQAAFQVTGVYPYDPTVITVQQMKPSEMTSAKGCFLFPSLALSVLS